MLSNETLGSIIDLNDSTNSSIVTTLTPYLPAMKRCGMAVFNTVVDAMSRQDWSRIDRELYIHMTENERDALGDSVLKDAREAVKHAYEAKRSLKEDLLRIVLGIAVSLV